MSATAVAVSVTPEIAKPALAAGQGKGAPDDLFSTLVGMVGSDAEGSDVPAAAKLAPSKGAAQGKDTTDGKGKAEAADGKDAVTAANDDQDAPAEVAAAPADPTVTAAAMIAAAAAPPPAPAPIETAQAPQPEAPTQPAVAATVAFAVPAEPAIPTTPEAAVRSDVDLPAAPAADVESATSALADLPTQLTPQAAAPEAVEAPVAPTGTTKVELAQPEQPKPVDVAAMPAPTQPVAEAPPVTTPAPTEAAAPPVEVQLAAAETAFVAQPPAAKPAATAAAKPMTGATRATGKVVAETTIEVGASPRDADLKVAVAATVESETTAPAVEGEAAQATVEATAEPAPAASAPGQVQGATTQSANNTPAPAAAATAGTVTHLAVQIARRVEAKSSRFDLQLDPDGLGQVNVTVQIDARGRLSAALAFDRPEAAEALKARAGELRAALERSGFDLSGGGLSFDTREGGASSFMADAEGGREQSGGPRRGRAFGAATDTADQADLAAIAARSRKAAGGLDIRI